MSITVDGYTVVEDDLVCFDGNTSILDEVVDCMAKILVFELGGTKFGVLSSNSIREVANTDEFLVNPDIGWMEITRDYLQV